MNTIYTSMNFIDVENNSTTYMDMSNSDDARNYVNTIMTETIDNDSKKKYKVSRETTEVVAHVLNSFSNQTVDNTNANNVAKRLLRVEVETQERIERLNKRIKRGSLIQSLFEIDNVFYYIISKVDSDSFLDETDLNKKLGLRYEDKAFKNCLFKYTNGEISNIYISDTNSTDYWHNGFLELEEVLTSSKNTKQTFAVIEKILKKDLKDLPSELTIHRNSLLSYFKNNETYDVGGCITHVFGDIEHEKFDVEPIKNKIRERTASNGLDTQFTIESSAISSRKWKEVKPVNNFIDITLNGADEYIQETVTSVSEDNKKFLKILVTEEDTYEAFNWND